MRSRWLRFGIRRARLGGVAGRAGRIRFFLNYSITSRLIGSDYGSVNSRTDDAT